MKKLNNSGFGGIGILVIIILLSVLGGTGYYVYSKNNNRHKIKPTAASPIENSQQIPPTSGNPTTTSPESIAQNSSTVVFKEIGVKMSVPEALKDLIYMVEKQTDPDGKEVIYVRLSTASLAKQDAYCNAASSALGVLTKGSGDLGTVSQGDSYHYYYSGSVRKQFNGYFVTYSRTKASCTGSKSLFTEQQALIDLTEAAAKSITETQ